MVKVTEVMLETKHIKKAFGGITVLKGINLEIKKGEVHTLLGANGAGKSTLIKIIDGIHTDFEGEIFINGERVRPKNPNDARLLGIGMVHQELSLIPTLSVAENVFIGRLPKLANGLVNFKKLYRDCATIFEEINITIKPNEMVKNLSIADRQMVEIAKMLSHQSEIILLDEPTSSLSDDGVERLFKTVEKLRENGKAIIFITHKFEEIFAISDRVTVLRDGQQIDTIDLNMETAPHSQLETKLVSLMTGTHEDEIGELYPKKAKEISDEVVFEVQDYTQEGKYDQISFQIKRGEIVGLVGLKGAGRTEVIRSIFGRDTKQSGRTFLNGEEITIKNPRDAIKKGIGLISEDRKEEGFVGCLGLKENINLTTIMDTVTFGLINKAKETKKMRDYIKKLNIRTTSEQALVRNLSGGNQQKVVISKWLAANCKVLLIDEPTRGIDVKAKSEIYQLIRDLADNGTAVLMITSELPELIGLSDRALVMHEGKIVNELVGDAINDENIMNSIFKHSA